MLLDGQLLKILLIATILIYPILNYLKVNMFVGIVIGAIIYIVMIFAERTLDNKDKSIIKSVLNK